MLQKGINLQMYFAAAVVVIDSIYAPQRDAQDGLHKKDPHKSIKTSLKSITD